jgi:WD40 repeat protein
MKLYNYYLCLVLFTGCDGGGKNNIVDLYDSSVTSVSLSPDSQLVATASMGPAIQIWEVATKTKRTEYPGTWSVDFSRDGKFVVSGCGTEQNIIVWDVVNNRKFVEFPNRDGMPGLCVKFFPDSRHVACGYGDGKIRVWSVDSGMETMCQQLSSDNALAVAVSPDSKLLAVGTFAGTIGIVDAITGNMVTGWWKAHAGHVYTLAFSNDGTWLSSAAHDMKIWTVPAGKQLCRLDTTDSIQAFAWSSDEKTLATGGLLNIRLWKWGITPRVVFEHRMRETNAMTISKDGTLLIVGGSDRGNGSELRFLDVK